MSECLDEGILQGYLDGELSVGNLENITSHLTSCLACTAVVQEMARENNVVAAALAPEFEAGVPTERLRQRIDAAMAEVSSVNRGALDVATLSKRRRWFQSVSDVFALTPQRAFGYAGLMAVLTFAVIFVVVQRHNFRPTSGNQSIATLELGTDSAPNGMATTRGSLRPDLNNKVVTGVTDNAGSRRPRNNLVRGPLPRTTPTVARHVKLLPGERSYLQTIAELDSTIRLDRGGMKPALQAEYERNLAFVDRALAAARTAAKSHPNDPDAAEFMFSAYQSKVDLLNTVADARVYDKQH
ncbi:MAG: hypothetical protein M3Y84_08120 [Acidobacteriota bacterium]|nr:hypothetical protein [Acidobacteriota bacterium]